MLYKRERRRNSLLIDLSPLIDVVFLLLIFFIVSTKFRDDAGMDLSLPSSESRQQTKEEFLTVFAGRDKTLRVGDRPVELVDLSQAIQQKLPDFKSKMVVLKVDKMVDHGTVVGIMDAAKKAGAEGLTFATDAKAAAGN
jgi:biopolymer transport protein ExbD